MKSFKKSIHSPEHQWLRQQLVEKRKMLGLSQRALAQQMDVIFSLIGKVETGDRRLDVIEFVEYCEALELEPAEVINQLNHYRSNLDESK